MSCWKNQQTTKKLSRHVNERWELHKLISIKCLTSFLQWPSGQESVKVSIVMMTPQPTIAKCQNRCRHLHLRVFFFFLSWTFWAWEIKKAKDSLKALATSHSQEDFNPSQFPTWLRLITLQLIFFLYFHGKWATIDIAVFSSLLCFFFVFLSLTTSFLLEIAGGLIKMFWMVW